MDDLAEMSEDLDNVYNEYIVYDRVRRLHEKLHEMSNKTAILKQKLDDYKQIQNQLKQYSTDPLEKLHDNAIRLKNRDIVERIEKISNDIKNMNNEVNDLYSNIDVNNDEIRKILKDLRNFGLGHIEVKKAVKQGQKILDEIKSIQMNRPEFNSMKKYCNKVFEDIKNIDSIYSHDVKDLKMDLDDFKKRLEDMKKIISKNMDTKNEYEEIQIEVAERLEQMQEKIEELNNINLESSIETQTLLNEAQQVFGNAQSNYDKLLNSTEFSELFKQLETGKYSNYSIPELTKLVEGAKQYAEHLQKLADTYRK